MAARIAARIIAKVGNYEFMLEKRDHLKYQRLTACVRRDASATYDGNPFSCGKKEFQSRETFSLTGEMTRNFGLASGKVLWQVLWQSRFSLGLASYQG
jgi:hypothetical protein